MDEDQARIDPLDILTEQEVDLINYLRGYTEEGEPTPNGWRVTIEQRAGRWLVEHRHSFTGPTLIGESNRDFNSAWIDQTGADLRFHVEEPEPVEAAAASEMPERRPPRLTLIKGGADHE